MKSLKEYFKNRIFNSLNEAKKKSRNRNRPLTNRDFEFTDNSRGMDPRGMQLPGSEQPGVLSQDNIDRFGEHIKNIESAIQFHSGRPSGRSDLSGNVSHERRLSKIGELMKIRDDLVRKQEIAINNHKEGQFDSNRGHYVLTDPHSYWNI